VIEMTSSFTQKYDCLNVRPLTADEGGGYLVEFPDLPGCMSDGETVAEALANAADAQATWLAAMREAGRPIPAKDGSTANARKIELAKQRRHEVR